MLFSALVTLTAATAALGAVKLETRATTQAFCSSSDGVYTLSSFDAPVSGTGNANGLSTWSLSIDDTSAGYKQKVTGFGATVTDATVAVFNQLSSDKLTSLLNSLMTSAGVNFSLLRHTIAASDLSADPAYTYDDNNGSPDVNFASFNLGDRGSAMAALLKKMKSLNSGLTLLGTPWGPPPWMKENGVITGTTVNNNLNHTYATQFGQYFVKYLQAYQNAGVTVDAITIQNEPLNSNAGMPTMYVYADESGNLIQQHVGPAIQSAGFNTEIWAYDHNTDHPEYPQTVLNEASEYVSAAAWHCYASNNNWSVLTDFHNTNPNVAQYMTECWTSPETSWSQAADFAMGPLQNWAQGAMAWTLGSDTSYGPHLSGDGACTDCRGLVVVDTSSNSYSFPIDYYMIGQFSKFIPKGATVLSGSGSYTYSDGTGIESVASLNPDNTRTVVIKNKFSNDVYVTLTTSTGEKWSGRVYEKSVVTWVLPASS